MHILGYSNDYKTCIRPCCFLNSFGSLVYSNTVAGSRSLGRTSRDPEVSRLPSCGSLHPLLLWESSWSFPPLQHRTWVVLSSAVSLKTLSPPVPSACCAGASPPSPVTPLQPGHSFPRAAAVTSPREWHQTARDWDAAASFLWSPGWWKLLLCQGWLVQPMWALPPLQFWARTCPYAHCGIFEWNTVFMSEILCVFVPLKYVCCF